MTLNPNTEKTLEAWYQQFHDNHDAMKEDFLERQSIGLFETETRDPLESTYDHFSQRHDELKQKLFSDIPGTTPPNAPSDLSFPISRKIAFQLAVCLLVAVSIFAVPSLLSKPAYALNDVFSRVSSARSVFFDGYSFSLNESGTKFPIEFYAKSPNTFWLTIFKTIRDEKGRTFVETGYRGSDGGTLFQVSNNPSKSAIIDTFARRDLPVWSNIEMQSRLSQTVGADVFFSSTNDFDYIGREQFEGVRCDVFERTTGEVRQRLYVDPSRKVPVGAAAYANDNVKALWVINRVVLDPTEIPDHISIGAPDVPNQELQTALERFTEDPRFAHTEVHIPFATQFGKSTLVCWADPYSVALQPPEFELVTTTGDSVAASVLDLGPTNDDKVTWNWVQLTPLDSNLQSSPFVKVTTNHHGRTIVPIKLGADEIADLIGTMSADDEASDKTRILELIGIPPNAAVPEV